MKQLNGKPIVRYKILAHMECTPEQADHIISAPTESEALNRLRSLIISSLPVNEIAHHHMLDDFRQEYGESLVAQRANELKQLTAPADL